MTEANAAADRLAAAGVTLDAAANRIVWRLERVPARVEHIVWPGNDVTLAAVTETGAGIDLLVEARAPFDLEVETSSTTFSEPVPAGRTRYMLTFLDRTDVRQV